MSFYNEWEECVNKNMDDTDFIEAFLKRKVYTITPLLEGSKDDIVEISKFLLKYNVDKIIMKIDESYITSITSKDVIQFSNFEKGTIQITQILYDNDKGLMLSEIGRKLIGSERDNAATKYGENHSKLAREFNLVVFTNEKPTLVKNSNFGDYFAFFDEEDQYSLLAVLGLRDPLIINLIAKSKKGITYYSDEVSCLSESTQRRRKGNVKFLFELVLKNDNDSIKQNMMW